MISDVKLSSIGDGLLSPNTFLGVTKLHGFGREKYDTFGDALIHVLYNSRLTFSIVYIAYSSIQ